MNKLPVINIVNHHHLCFDEAEYIGRGSPLGNPFSHMSETKAETQVATREDAIAAYKEYLLEQIQKGNQLIIDELDRLALIAMSKGKLTLRCYCAPKPCHGDIIKEMILEAIKEATSIS